MSFVRWCCWPRRCKPSSGSCKRRRCVRKRRRCAIALAVIGVAAGISLVLDGSFLGTEGNVYRWVRRYGTVVYFGGTCLAMLVLARALQRLHRLRKVHLPRIHERALLVLLTLIVALGLGNALAGLWANAALKDHIENATEWWGAFGLTLGFVVITSLWRHWDLRVQLTTNGSAAPPGQ
jgi:hypothetical protein